MADPRLIEALQDRYRIEGLIGEGGMATVHLAEDLKHGRKVALKVLRPELSIAGDRFLREVRVTAGLQHPGIVPLYDSGEADGLLYYVMPWIEGESLRERLDREGRIPLDESLRIIQIVASTLHYAHDRGVVHRDVKPSNILLGAHGTVVVADFGVAHAVQAAGEERLTAIGHSVGTPTYMSPEQASGDEDVDARSDIYALGAMAYEMLSGKPPFEGGSMAALLTRKLTQAAPTLDEVPPEVRRMVQQALETDRDRRHASAKDFAETVVGVMAAGAPRGGREMDPKGIVVLPFRNLSPDPDNAYFAEGLTEEVTSDLSQLRSLRVIARTTAVQAAASNRPVGEIAAELGVAHVLEGSVRKAGNAVRVTVQLIDAATDRQLWSSKFNGTLDDVFEIQERVAEEVVNELKISLTDEEKERISDRRAEDPRVLDLMMRVNHEIWRMERSSFQRAEALLARGEELVATSPKLRAMKANLLFQSVNLGYSSDESRVQESEDIAFGVLRDDPECALAYSTLAWIVGSRRQRLAEALEYAERGYELDPGDSTAKLGLIVMSGFIGLRRNTDIQLLLDDLIESDPLWVPSWVAGNLWSSLNGRWEDAVAYGRQGLSLDTDGAMAVMVAYSEVQLGHFEAAQESLASASAANGAWGKLSIALRHAAAGEFEEAAAMIDDEVVAWAKPDAQYAWHVADVYALIGDEDSTLDWLEIAVDDEFLNWKVFAEYDRLFEGLREHPRFLALLDRARRGQQRLAARWGVEVG